MEKSVINATRRDVVGKKVGVLRREGKLPAVIYGHNVEPTPILLDLREASRMLHLASTSSLITIVLEGKELAVLVREKQRNFIKNELIHVDFQVVSLTEKIRAKVDIELSGVSPAIKNFNAVAINGLSEIEIECLPQDLPERVTLDLSMLANIGDGIYVRDVNISDKVEILTDLDEMIVIMTGGTTEEEAAEGEVAEIEPEVIEKGKKEEDEED